nr:MAG TPA: hypothetical protein [Caudoviricetes sp.]
MDNTRDIITISFAIIYIFSLLYILFNLEG